MTEMIDRTLRGRELAGAVVRYVRRHPDRFDMGSWAEGWYSAARGGKPLAEVDVCGTSQCLAGTAVFLAAPQGAFYDLVLLDYSDYGAPPVPPEYAEDGWISEIDSGGGGDWYGWQATAARLLGVDVTYDDDGTPSGRYAELRCIFHDVGNTARAVRDFAAMFNVDPDTGELL